MLQPPGIRCGMLTLPHAPQVKGEAAAVMTEATAWAQIMQQLSDSPVHSTEQGQAAVAAVLGSLESLTEQQQLAFEELASRDDALDAAVARIGAVTCLVLQSHLPCMLDPYMHGRPLHACVLVPCMHGRPLRACMLAPCMHGCPLHACMLAPCMHGRPLHACPLYACMCHVCMLASATWNPVNSGQVQSLQCIDLPERPM